MERVLVTGANGFIASHIVRDLLKDGKYLVRGTVRDPSNEKKTSYLKELKGASDNLELVALDLLNSTAQDFKQAVSGCDYVLHTASPFPLVPPKNEDDLIKPAVKGTVAVLEACLDVPSVKRVVVTSSCAAIGYGHKEKPTAKYNEDTWTEVENLGKSDAYVKSKTLAEMAAWDFIKEKQPHFTLTTINPAGVFGPSVSPNPGTSLEIINSLMTRKIPMLPNIWMGLVDVRDVAQSHIKAFQTPDAAGKRIVNCAEEVNFHEVGAVLNEEFAPMGYKPATKHMPKALVWAGSFVSGQMAVMNHAWGREFNVDGSNATKVLGIQYRDVRKAVIESGHALIEHGVLPKEKGYVPLQN